MRIKVFGKQECEACDAIKKKFRFFLDKWGAKHNLLFFDLDTLDGVTEGALYNALDAPTTIIEENGQEIARWEGRVPESSEFKGFFKEQIETQGSDKSL